jgi:hypothetical protein
MLTSLLPVKGPNVPLIIFVEDSQEAQGDK